MSTGIHRYSYSSARPPTPNTTLAPLGNAPGATVEVFLTGGPTPASLFTNQALSNPLANPFVSDVNAFYAYYVDPTLGDVDEQFSGTGIITPYTLSAVLDLDPRVGNTAGDVTALAAVVAAETAARIAADLAIEQTGMAIPLGGSLSQGILQGTRFTAVDAPIVNCPPLYTGAAGIVYATLRTDNAATSVTAYLRDLTAAADVGNSTAVVAIVNTLVTFAVTLTAGHQYQLQLIGSNATNAVYGKGYLGVAHS